MEIFLNNTELFKENESRIAPYIRSYFKNNTYENNKDNEFYIAKWNKFSKDRKKTAIRFTNKTLTSMDIVQYLIAKTSIGKLKWRKTLDSIKSRIEEQKYRSEFIQINNQYVSFELHMTKEKQKNSYATHYELKWFNKYGDTSICEIVGGRDLYEIILEKPVDEPKINPNSYIKPRDKDKQIDHIYIGSKDFVVKTHLFRCFYKEHLVDEIIGIVKLVTPNGDIKEESVSCAHCSKCNCFYMLSSQYEALRKKGILLCQLIDKEYYYKYGKLEFNAAKESLLMQNGYNVKANNGLSDVQRIIILQNIMDNNILSPHRISSYLDMFISQKKGLPQYEEAISKWEKDKQFVLDYKNEYKEVVNIDSIKC